MDTRWRIDLFGGLRARHGDHVVTRFETRKTGALLACLCLSLGRARTRDELAEQLWPDEDPDATRNRLRQALSALRRALELPDAPASSVLIADRAEVRLDADTVATDVAEFDALIRSAAGAASIAERRDLLARAAELYRGELLPGHYEGIIVAERERLLEAYQCSLHRLVVLLEEEGDLDRALDYARRAVGADPLREEAHRDLIHLYGASGRVPEALRQYRELERVLREELGAAPSPAAQALAERLRSESSGAALSPANLSSHPRPSSSEAEAPDRSRAAEEQREVGPSPRPEPASNRTPTSSPIGTVTFLFTDIQGSTQLWAKSPGAMKLNLARHDVLLRQAIEESGGCIFKTVGDGFCAAFKTVRDALTATVATQRRLAAEPWEGTGPLRVRMALHVGEAEERDGDYFGPPLNQVARLLASAHGGQTLLSRAAVDLARDVLPANASLRDLGEHHLRDLNRPEHIFQLLYPGLATDFPPLRSIGKVRGYPDRPWQRKGARWAAVAASAVVVLAGLVFGPLGVKKQTAPPPGTRIASPSQGGNREHHAAAVLYGEGRDHWNLRTESGLLTSIDRFGKAIAVDKSYAPAYAGLADAYSLLGYYGFAEPRHVFPLAQRYAGKALELNPHLAEAHASLAWVKTVFGWDWPGAGLEFKKAIELDSQYETAHQWLSFYLMVLKRPKDSKKEIDQALKLNGLSAVISKSAGQRSYHARDYDRAISEFNEAIRKDGPFSLTHHWLGLAYEQKALEYQRKGKIAQRQDLMNHAIREFEKAITNSQRDPTMVAGLAHAYAVSGFTDDARRLLSELLARRKQRYVTPVALAAICVGLGDRKQALNHLEAALSERAGDLVLVNIEPRFDDLRQEQRFIALLKAMGLPT